MVGTEEIGFPIIINSEFFKPRIERDGIYLKSTEEGDSSSLNKKIIQDTLSNSLKLYSTFCSDENIEGLFELFNLNISRDLNWIDHDWLNDLKKHAIKELMYLKVVQCSKQSTPVCLLDIKIPFTQLLEHVQKLFDLLLDCKEINVPLVDEIFDWITVVQNWSSIHGNNHSLTEFPFVWNIKNLIEFVSNNKTANELSAKLTAPLKEWINAFYPLVISIQKTFPLDSKIVINQDDEICLCENMEWDECQDQELVLLSNLLGLNFGKKLFSHIIEPFHILGIKAFTEELAIDQLKSKLNDLSSDKLSSPDVLKSNARFIKWLIDKNYVEIIEETKIITGVDNDNKIGLDRFRKGEHLYLSPKSFFSSTYPLYAALIRDKDCLHDIYIEYLSEENFRFLEAHGLIHISPLIIKKEVASVRTIELLISDEKDLSKLKNTDGQYEFRPELTYTDFAYFTGNDGHIFDRNKSQKASFERFKFLLEEAVEKDPFFEYEIQEVRLEGVDNPIKFNTCTWVARIKRLQWVYYKTENTTIEIKFVNETPSSKNLSELLKYDESLVKTIRGSKQQLLLQKLGIGVSELIRNTLESEELRFSWDKAITNMITSNADPELVQEIFSDANIKEEYEKKLQQRRLIKRNQNIGYLVEQLFREHILELKNEGYNISINRKPFGSDYIVSEESSDLVNNKNQLELFEINEWLVELKATGKSYAAMTELQAETAFKRKEKYALVVVELDGSNPDLEYVKNTAVVVDTIGEKIEKIIPFFKEVQIKKNELDTGTEGISVNIEENNVRFRVQSEVWHNNKLSIAEFIKAKFKFEDKIKT